MQRSIMFLNNLTCIDHAHIDAQGRVIGGSYHANFLIGGNVEEKEQVVVDFSRIKKDVKTIIDDRDGFDHKLWLIPGLSACEYSRNGDRVTVTSEACELSMPADAVRVFHDTNTVENVLLSAQSAIQKHVWQELDDIYEQADITVECALTETQFCKNPKFSFPFRYTHGLKNSSSYGCQNLAHGHLSWIEIEHDAFYDPKCKDCKRAVKAVSEIAAQLNEAVLIFADNIYDQTYDAVQIRYETERGEWRAKYQRDKNKLIVMERETTIENVLDWIVNQHVQTLMMGHVKRLYVSEGLAKGAVKEFSF